jgi:hypothetical protein
LRLSVSFLVLALLLGCGSPAPTTESLVCDCPAPALVPHDHPHEHDAQPSTSSFVAGSRLVPMHLAGSDGSRGPAFDAMRGPGSNAWFDLDLGVECSFVPAPNDAFVCLPRVAPVQNWHLDAACTQKIAMAANCGALPSFGQEKTPDACGSLDIGTVYALYPDQAASNVTLYWLGPNGCQAQPGSLGPNNVAIPVGKKAPAGAFVTATAATLSPP